MSLTGQVLRLHERVYKLSDGRIGHRMLGVPTLLLETTGRRSGVTRTNALVYASDGADYLVVASNGGQDRPPAWLHNLGADPRSGFRSGVIDGMAGPGLSNPPTRTTSACGSSSTRTTATATRPTRSRRRGRSRSLH